MPLFKMNGLTNQDNCQGTGDTAIARAKMRVAEADKRAEVITRTFIGIGILFFVLSVGAALFLSRIIAKPLKEITSAAERIASGDLGVAIVANNREDEVGNLTKAFTAMVRYLQNMAEISGQIAGGDLTMTVKPISDKDVLGNAFVGMTGYLHEMATVSKQVSEGDLTVTVKPVSDKDLLRNAFANMLAKRRRINQEICEIINVLASSSSEILASTAQIAAGMSETATSVTETTATMEEIKQTALLSSKKSGEFRKRPEIRARCRTGQCDGLRDDGRDQPYQEVDGNGRRERGHAERADAGHRRDHHGGQRPCAAVESPGCECGDRGIEGRGARQGVCGGGAGNQESGGSVEAGDGTGPDNSRRYPEGDRQIGAGHGAGEQGGGGRGEADDRVRESIWKLAEIGEAAQAAEQIAVSNQQQLTGIEQVAIAMENIKQATHQNILGTRQAEQAAHTLNELGQKLKEMVAGFKV